jgi:polysaccharide biosynthesis transport protein
VQDILNGPTLTIDRGHVTAHQIFAALWRRKWIIVAVMVLAAIVAAVYLQRVTPNYESTATVRLSPTISQAASTGQLGTATAVDADPSVITSPKILDAAAKNLGEPAASLDGAISYAVVPSDGTSTVMQLTITASAPTAVEAQKRANAVVKSLATYYDGLVATTLASLQKQVADLQNQANQLQTQLTQNPGNTVIQSNLTDTLGQISTLRTQIAALQNAGGSVAVTSPAPPGSSTNPSLLIVVALALVCGLLAGAGVALIRDHFDERLRSEDEIEPLTGLAALGVLANDREVARRKLRLPAASAQRTALSEGIRSLRTTVQVLLPDAKGVIVITSVEPGDGKTFVSANLALSWARAGRKVILVGGDLRRPELGAYFANAADGRGLGGLLADSADGKRPPNQAQIAEALRPTPFRGLRVLPAGDDHFDEPADLLASASLERIIRYLGRLADIVVIDTPPSLALADASELAAYADGTLVLATINHTRRSLMVDTVDSLRANGVNVFGMVVNRSHRRLPKSYTSYYVSSSRSQQPFARTARPRPDEEQDDADILDGLGEESEATPSGSTPSSGRLRRDGNGHALQRHDEVETDDVQTGDPESDDHSERDGDSAALPAEHVDEDDDGSVDDILDPDDVGSTHVTTPDDTDGSNRAS